MLGRFRSAKSLLPSRRLGCAAGLFVAGLMLVSCNESSRKSSARVGLDVPAADPKTPDHLAPNTAQVAAGETKVIADGEVTAVVSAKTGDLQASIKRLADDIQGSAANDAAARTFETLKAVTDPKLIAVQTSAETGRVETKLIVTAPKSEAHKPLFVAVLFPDEKPEPLLVILPFSGSLSAEFKTLAQRFVVAVVSDPDADLPQSIRVSRNPADLLREPELSISPNKTTSTLASTTTLPPTSDVRAPDLTAKNPDGGSVGVSPMSAISATFNEAILSASLTQANMSLVNEFSGAPIPASLSLQDGGRVTRLDPLAPLPKDAVYQVTLAGVKDLAGNALQSPSTWTFQTEPRQWQAPVLLDSENLGSVQSPRLAFGKNGHGFAIWVQYDGLFNNVWVNRFLPGSGWQGAVLLENEAGSVWTADIAVDDNGNAMATWPQDINVTKYKIVTRYYSTSSGWQAPVTITSDAPTLAYSRVAFDASGNATVIWFEGVTGSSALVFAKRYVPATGWTTSTVIMPLNEFGNIGGISVGIDAYGNATVVWYRSPGGGGYSVYSARYVAGIGWNDQVVIGTYLGGSIYPPKLAVAASGSALVAWSDLRAGRQQIVFNRYLPDSGWGSEAVLDSGSSGAATRPSVALHDSGAGVIAWQQSDGTRDNIWLNRYLPEAGWQMRELVEENNTGAATLPAISVDAFGNTAVIWQHHDGTRENIWVRYHNRVSGWQAPLLIETDNSGAAAEPMMTFDATGAASCIWLQSDGTRVNVWSRRFE